MSNGRMENMLSQLITMVGSIQAEIIEIKSGVKELKERQGHLESISEKRHIEIQRGFRSIRAD